MAVTSGILVVAGAALSAYGQYESGRAQKKAADYNAQVLENNAKIEEQKAALEEVRARQQGRMALSTARSKTGAMGITAEGSPLDALRFSAQNAEQDALLVRYGGTLNAEANRNQATLYRYQGKQAMNQAYIGAASSLVSGAGKAVGGGYFSGFSGTTSPSSAGLRPSRGF